MPLSRLTLRGISTQACSARGTVSLYMPLSTQVHSEAGFGPAVHAVCWTRPPLTFRMPRSVLSARGTVTRQLECAAVGSNAQLCWLWACRARGVLDVAAVSFHTTRSGLSLRHRQLVCAAVGSNAQLCWLWACSACGVLDVAAADSSYASQCAQLEAPSACMCSCRLPCTQLCRLCGLAVHAVRWPWPPLAVCTA